MMIQRDDDRVEGLSEFQIGEYNGGICPSCPLPTSHRRPRDLRDQPASPVECAAWLVPDDNDETPGEILSRTLFSRYLLVPFALAHAAVLPGHVVLRSSGPRRGTVAGMAAPTGARRPRKPPTPRHEAPGQTTGPFRQPREDRERRVAPSTGRL